jgi:hypothetical protein
MDYLKYENAEQPNEAADRGAARNNNEGDLVKEAAQAAARFHDELRSDVNATTLGGTYKSLRQKLDIDSNDALSEAELRMGIKMSGKMVDFTGPEDRLANTLLSNVDALKYVCPQFESRGLTSDNATFLDYLKQHGSDSILSTKTAVYGSALGTAGMFGGLGTAVLFNVGRTGVLAHVGVGLALGIAASAGIAYWEYNARKPALEKLLTELP